MPVQAAIYVRISSDRQGAGLGVSRQEQDCRRVAGDLGWSIAQVYSDNDISAYSGRPRPRYQDLLEDIRCGAVSAVLTWHTDRLHRSPKELEEYVDLSERFGVVTHTVKAGELDLSTPAGRAVARTLGAWARYESEHKSARISRRHLQKAEAGEYRGGSSRPFGYQHDGMTLDAMEAREVRAMTAKVISGESLGSIIRDLNGRGVLTTRGSVWTYSSLRALLLRPRNAGLSVYRGQVVGKAQWPALVSHDNFLNVQAILSDPRRRTTTGRARVHLLAGLARCGRCGSPMRSGWVGDRTGKKYHLYRCCVHRSEQKLDRLVRGCVLRLLVNHEARRLLSSAPGSPATDEERDIDGRLQEAAHAYAEGLITMSQMSAITQALTDRKRALAASAADQSRTLVLGDLIGVDDLVTRWDTELSLARQRAVIDTLMVITVHPVGRGAKDFRAGVEITLKSDVAKVIDGDIVASCLYSRLDDSQAQRITRMFAI